MTARPTDEYMRLQAAVHQAGERLDSAKREVARLRERLVFVTEYRKNLVGQVSAELQAAEAAETVLVAEHAAAQAAQAALPNTLIVGTGDLPGQSNRDRYSWGSYR